MIGDKIIIKPQYRALSEKLLSILNDEIPIPNGKKWTIGIGGESGSGKSVTAYCLADVLAEHGYPVQILHLDDYFRVPPLTNHEYRLRDIGRVGEREVNLELLQSHLDAFLEGHSSFEAPEVNYRENKISSRTIDMSEVKVMIVEGTYAMMLQRLGWRIHMGRDFRETKEKRLQRRRENDDPFIEKVLAIEHQIIRPLGQLAHIQVSKEYDAIWQGS